MHFKISIVGIGLAGEQRLEFAARDLVLELAQRRFRLADDFLIALGFAELDHGNLVVELLLDAGNGGKLILERSALLHQPAGAGRIVPEIGVFGLLVQLGKPGARFIDVKDASSAARRTA
jgi:hypothetical protein